MKLFEFHYSENTDFEGFLKMMREKHPTIIGRKRFCVHPEEITEQLKADIAAFGVSLEETDK